MKLNRLGAMVLMDFFTAPVLADNPACHRKSLEIEQQIIQAKQAGHTNRASGLEKALSRVMTHCTDAELVADQKEEITDQQEDIDEVLGEINEKLSEGRYDKVRKLERKLQREQDELEVLQRELRDMQG